MRLANDALAGCRVLVTRPEPFGHLLAEEIKKTGGIPILFPVIEITPLPCDFTHLQDYDWLIFMSPQTLLHSSISRFISSKNKIAAIGAATADALKSVNIAVDIQPEKEWSSEGLLALPVFEKVAGKKIAIISGKNGRTWLQTELTRRGAIVTKFEVYERLLPKTRLKNYAWDVAICSSNETVANFKQLADDRILTMSLLVISQRVADYAESQQFQRIFLANNASHHAILDGLISLWSNQ